ncbi:hypothetical protein E3D00_06825 [Swingsia samuiensis]|uniref:Metallo-beta-lactamase domain-containing protein n=2 Tax=Swingsia samuiensis TaxID=1293412 RepID=A0A4Y6UNU5_9PROT|nr:hypothetical protein E3D00_06825 [Swingsia samuiensis]
MPLHFDGNHYTNPQEWTLSNTVAKKNPFRKAYNILKWQLKNRPRWPSDLPIPPQHDLPTPLAGEYTATFIGHSTVLLQFGQRNAPPFRIITDPIFSERCSPFRHFGPKRVIPPGIALEKLPPIDLILVSHCHYDHMDLPSLRVLAKNKDILCISLPGNRKHLAKAGLSRIIELDWWENIALENGFSISATPALHNSARTPFDTNKALWGGFMIQTEKKCVFFAGDTAWGYHFDAIHQKWPRQDLAILPIGAYSPRSLLRSQHMNPEEAVMAFKTLNAEHGLAIHFGTFQLTDEPILEPVARLNLAMRGNPKPFIALESGETLTLSRHSVTG